MLSTVLIFCFVSVVKLYKYFFLLGLFKVIHFYIQSLKLSLSKRLKNGFFLIYLVQNLSDLMLAHRDHNRYVQWSLENVGASILRPGTDKLARFQVLKVLR